LNAGSSRLSGGGYGDLEPNTALHHRSNMLAAFATLLDNPRMSTALDAAVASFENSLRGLGLTGEEAELGDAAQFGQWAAISAAAGALWFGQGIAPDDPEPPCAHCGPAGSVWHVRFGPLLDTRRAQALLGVKSHQDFHQLIEDRQLLAFSGHEGQMVVPAFQIGDNRSPMPAVPAVLGALAENEILGWKVATWLFNTRDDLDGQAPIAWLRAGRDVDRVLVAARNTPRPLPRAAATATT
jgi:hypothetical protein